MTTDPAGVAAQLWADFAEQVRDLPARVFGAEVPTDELHRAEGTRYLLRYLAAGISTCVEFDDTLHPELGALIENRRSWGLDNPDTKYSFTRVEPGATYVVSGDLGSSVELELQLDSGHFADGGFADWRCLGRWTREDFSPRPADGVPELRITAPADASHLHLREYFGDWESETPALLSVRREGAPLPPPPLDMATLAARMDLLGLWLTAGATCWADLGRGLAGAEPGPVVPFVPPATATGLGGQAYGMGPYRCGPGEAVVLRFRPPPARYWSVSLATWFWESTDIANRQCSLNHTQAHVDDDGTAHMVLAHEDPGVANWLDTGGYPRGTLALRLLHADPPDGGAGAVLTQRTVPLSGVADALPGDTPRVDAHVRAAVLARRRDALVRRYRR